MPADARHVLGGGGGYLNIKKPFLSQPFSRLLHHANAFAHEAPQPHRLHRHAVFDRTEGGKNLSFVSFFAARERAAKQHFTAVGLPAHAVDGRAGIATELVHGSQESRGSNQMV